MLIGLAEYRNTVTNKPKKNKSAKASSQAIGRVRGPGQVRIIGGQWRGRKLDVADVSGLRPTGDRVRETLFNWLQADIAGAHCLDLFAGSGALGFESLSRHAASVTFVEPEPRAQQALVDSSQLLGVELGLEPAQHLVVNASFASRHGARLYKGAAESALNRWRLHNPIQRFDLVFIDPPFDMACQWQMVASLTPDFLSDNALVYVEAPYSQAGHMLLPRSCEVVREKRFGDILTRLLSYCVADVQR